MMSLAIRLFKIEWIPTLSFLFASILWRTEYYRLSLYAFIPLIICYTLIKHSKLIIKCQIWESIFILFVLILISSAISKESEASFRIMIPVTASLLLSLSIYALALRGNNYILLCIAFIALYVSIMYMTISDNSFNADFNYENELEREKNTLLNANQYAYFSLFAIIATRLLIGRKKIGVIIKLTIYVILIFCACFTALMTASRQVLLLEIPLMLVFIYIDFIKNSKMSNIILFFIFSFFALAIGLPYFFQYYENSYLAVRASTEISKDSRSYLLVNALEIGATNPIFGVGLGAKEKFSHCTYTHLFSRCGIFATFIYIFMLTIPMITQYIRYYRFKDSFFLILFFCSLVFIIANFFYSYIDQPFMLSLFFLIIGISDRYYNIHNSTIN